MSKFKERKALINKVMQERMDTCNSCPDLKNGICKHCKCIMRLKTKLPFAECPIGKWGKM